MLKRTGSVALVLLFLSGSAFAREPDEALPSPAGGFDDAQQPRRLHLRPLQTDVKDDVSSAAPEPSATQAAVDGLLSPFTTAAVISSSRASARSYVGYDGAVSLVRAQAAAEGNLTSYLALRVEFEHGPAAGVDDRVSIGARFGLLTQRQYGVDLGAGLFYQPKDFRGEGNVVSGLMLARHFGRLGLFANGLFGSDPEGDDQLLEARLGSLYAVSNWLSFGVDGRSRMNFSRDQKRLLARTVDWELQAAPTAIFCLSQFSLMGLLGPSVVRETPATGEAFHDSRTRVGLLAMAGAGGSF